MKIDLKILTDDELREVIAGATELLKQRDTERKETALEAARELLAAAGLTMKDLATKRPAKKQGYKSGHTYQHPDDKTVVWNGTGVRPGWVKKLEAEGKAPIEVQKPTLAKVG